MTTTIEAARPTPARYRCPADGGHPWVGTATGFPEGYELTCLLHQRRDTDPPALAASVVTAMAFPGEGPTTARAAAQASRAAGAWLAGHGITPDQIVGSPVASLHARGGLGGVVVRYILIYTLCVAPARAAQIAAEEGPA